ncbi:hypothetical protein DMN91_000267 [Ooceraea biroi]|uniref:Squamous cell carcinoma antigen recognized by T-cells n=1 Tax=Ooceraea biroi TaxID=2015173 RepID=A0A026WD74_OOCBI|nr:squamous cell carcinoma antigen recognized by T-cells 3 [Ooceraea biroi]XP_011338981.1 squamous cell carcinoma antigen recognized by T-cells 3 [Ooceraea biroi]EZA54025.1 Squamous cell carcinoma antigen recognized by T-cells [Ooceraea biroi]RLU26471.1 hypothetical protein DMN91_000267 [Ooceraea biroi]
MDVSMEETDETARQENSDVEEETIETEARAESNEEMDEENESDSDEVDDDEVDADEAEVNSLQALLRKNPYDYTSHTALIKKLQEMGNERYRLLDARQNMSNAYPLSPELWLSWIRDEIELALTDEDKVEITQLCERAVEDYVSVEVWLEYLQFSIGNMGSEKDAAKHVRKLFERALIVVGLHTTKGAIIWEAFREFETVLLALIDSANLAGKKDQLGRIASLFQRQLACPLLNMEKTYEEYQSWHMGDGAEATIDDNIISVTYERAFAKLSTLLPYEEKLISAQGESELTDAYKGYLLYEKQQRNQDRIVLLYERAITDLSLEIPIWLDYLNYLEDTIKDELVLLPVYKRASRNIPWCSKVWQKWMRSSEMWGEHAQVQELFGLALSSGFSTANDYRNVWLTYLEHQRRRIEQCSEEEREKCLDIIRRTFDKACERLANDFGLDGDPNCIILQYWARTEAIHGNNMEKARTLWADILSQGHSATASYWLEYISLERCYGDTKHLRKLFQKALASVKDWPESIANAWIDFERDKGTLEQMQLCEVKTKEKIDKVMEERQKEQQVPILSESREFTRNKKATKRKLSDDTGKWKHLGNSSTKIVKSNLQAKSKGENLSDTVGGRINEKTQEKPKSLPPPGFQPEDKDMDDKDSEHEIDSSITVFVSNLDYTVTEDEVRDALKPAGSVTSFRMVKDYKGRGKGYCYVQLSSAEAVGEALKLDRTPINGRPMFVSRCNPNKDTRSSGFKYSSRLEKNKLFVKGLPLTITKEELEEIFKVHGNLKEVRMVTYRNGHSKGLAYVEYHEETTAAKALLTSDGMKIQDKVITVAISKPPDRKKTQTVEEDKEQVKSLGGTTTSRTTFGVPKTLLSMVPRNVKANVSNGNGNTSRTGNGVAQPMNNQDFRNMFLKKK